MGHPAEGKEAGGQRPRNDFSTMFFDGKWGQPFERDEAVVAKLTEARLLQPSAPLPHRQDEMTFLARMYGYPEDTGV